VKRAAVAVAIGLAALAAAQDPSYIRVSVRVVSLPTLVFSRENKLIPNLQPGDFHVTDNGKPQEVTVEEQYAPISVVLAVQMNNDVRQYSTFIMKVGSVVDALLVGESGEGALITYNGEVTVAKPFDAGNVQEALRQVRAGGREARMLDAGTRAVHLLAARPKSRSRLLLFIGQPFDSGSETDLASLQRLAEKENVAIYALALPQFGQAFVSDTFSLEGLSSRAERGGFKAGVNLGQLVSALSRSARTTAMSDPFSILTAATGGTQLHFRTQSQLEDALSIVGVEVRSLYLLSFYPTVKGSGHHTVKVGVNVSGAQVYSRPGYWSDNP
jgi:VWFA-related protein